MLLREYRSRARGLADLLNYAVLVDEGILLNKDGSFTAGMFYAGPDLDAAGHAELAALSSQVNQALATLGDGWMIHVDALRLPSMDYPEEGAFPDPVTRLIDEERRRSYRAEVAHYESVYVLTVTYLTPTDTESWLSRLFVSGASTKGTDIEAPLRTFQAQISALQDMLSARLTVLPMTSEDLLTHLHLCITGLNHRVRLPAIPCYLDSYLASQDLIGGFEPQIGDKHLRTINVSGFPLESFPGILDFLNRLPIEYRWSTRFIFLDPATAERRLRIMRRNWFQKRHGLFQLLWQALNNTESNFENRDALDMATDADEALSEAAGGTVRYGYYTCTLILMSEKGEVVDILAREVRKEFANRGFPARIETINALEAYIGSLPGHGYQNVRRSPIHTLNLADLLPLTSVWPGLEHNPCSYYPEQSPALLTAATSGATPFRLNLHVSDVGHTLIVGPTGSGKSSLIGLIQAQFLRYPDAQIFTFDKGYSSFPLCAAAGGIHYDIAGEDDRLSFCPLAYIDQPAVRLWAEDWLEALFDLQGIRVTPKQRGLITNALRLLSEDEYRSLTDLKNTLQDESLRAALDHYTLSGALGGLLDAQHDALANSHFQVFEIEHLLNMGKTSAVPVLLYLFHAIERRLDGCPTLIILEEAWLMLMHSLFAAKIEEWLRVLRKRNAAVVFVTQSLGEITRSERGSLILESCPTKIFLPNPEAMAEQNAALYRSIGLNDRQIEILAYAIPKREYLYTSPLGRRLIDLDLGPVALSFVGATGKEDLAQIRHLIKSNAGTWPGSWLARRGLADAAQEWQALFNSTQRGKRRVA
jgi:type IV secretion/conjugal transfer VirB4 family ATPase